MVTEENTNTMHDYKLDYVEMVGDVELMTYHDAMATIITKYARRKVAYIELRQERKKKEQKMLFVRFFNKYVPGFMVKVERKKAKGLILLQGVVRGRQMRKVYYRPQGEHGERVLTRLKRRLSRNIWNLYRRFKLSKQKMERKLSKYTQDDWMSAAKKAKRPYRVLGIFEEFIYPDSKKDIRFYKNALTGIFTLEKPAKLKVADDQYIKGLEEIQVQGYTMKQNTLAIALQALFRGFACRNSHKIVAAAMKVSLTALDDYMRQPDDDHHLWNFALHCFTVEQDVQRARDLFNEGIRRMQQRGPDQPLILYAYAIFAFTFHDLDLEDIYILIDRAKKAETDREAKDRLAKGQDASQAVEKGTYEYGKIFRIADIGFFRYQSLRQQNALGYHSYAVCRFLIYDDFAGSFDAFLEAFRWDAKDKKLKANFDVMMQHFHGTDKEYLSQIVRDRMRIHAIKDEEVNALRQARYELKLKRLRCIVQLQKWYRARQFARNPPPVVINDREDDEDEDDETA